MPLFAGLERIEYQDVLRAAGRLLDDGVFRNFLLTEQEDGPTVQVPRSSGAGHGFETSLLTTANIEAPLHNAFGRPPAP
jgi:hypothetical protein